MAAQSGHPDPADPCPLSGVKRTWIFAAAYSVILTHFDILRGPFAVLI
jgi:hypothetical protein